MIALVQGLNLKSDYRNLVDYLENTFSNNNLNLFVNVRVVAYIVSLERTTEYCGKCEHKILFSVIQ